MKRNLLGAGEEKGRLGGGYKQREKRSKLEAEAKLKQSGLAQYMVLKYVFTEVFNIFKILELKYFRMPLLKSLISLRF